MRAQPSEPAATAPPATRKILKEEGMSSHWLLSSNKGTVRNNGTTRSDNLWAAPKHEGPRRHCVEFLFIVVYIFCYKLLFATLLDSMHGRNEVSIIHLIFPYSIYAE